MEFAAMAFRSNEQGIYTITASGKPGLIGYDDVFLVEYHNGKTGPVRRLCAGDVEGYEAHFPRGEPIAAAELMTMREFSGPSQGATP